MNKVDNYLESVQHIYFELKYSTFNEDIIRFLKADGLPYSPRPQQTRALYIFLSFFSFFIMI